MQDWSLIRLPIAFLLLYFVLRLILGAAGVPYEVGNNIFAMVPLTAHLCLIWGALSKSIYGKGAGGAAMVGVQIALVAQLLIFGATVVSYLLGVDTYFNHSQAVARTDEALTLGSAIGQRAFGLLVNCIIGTVSALIGYAAGGLVRSR